MIILKYSAGTTAEVRRQLSINMDVRLSRYFRWESQNKSETGCVTNVPRREYNERGREFNIAGAYFETGIR